MRVVGDSAAYMREGDWIAALLGRPVESQPRQSPDQIPAARAFWDLSHLNANLPAVARLEERVVLRERDGAALAVADQMV
jgi:hypothetical protein